MDSSSSERKIHPMVAVPDAIRAVLRQTALILLEKDKTFETLPTLSSHDRLLGKTLVEDVMMNDPGYPKYNASIMDGYVIKSSEEFTPGQAWTHFVAGKIFAGDEQNNYAAPASTNNLDLLTAYYITTGAPIPESYDCVVPVEQCQVSVDGQRIVVGALATIIKYKWIRKVGCDMPANSVVLPKGHVIHPVSIGLLLQSGCKSIKVKKPVIVGVLSTGNELLTSLDVPQEAGKIPDVNRPILLALLSTFGASCQAIDLGIQRDDDLEMLSCALKSALEKCDLIITSGGVSMGESDILEKVLVEKLNGTLHFGRMHMKPGKPTTLVSLPCGKLVFAMPGNPVSATVCTQLLVKPCIDLLYNGIDGSIIDSSSSHGEGVDEMVYRIVQNTHVHKEMTCKLSHNIKLDKERPEYHRVTFCRDAFGNVMAKSTGVQRSSRLINLRDAQGLLLLPQAVEKKEALAGEEYTALLLGSESYDHVKVCNSSHLNQRRGQTSCQISVVHVVDSTSSREDHDMLEKISGRVKVALGGGLANITSSQTYCGNAMNLFSTVTTEHGSVDVLVVVCKAFPGFFRYHLDLAAALRKQLVKVADSIALMARCGAASEDARSALFETVVGFVPKDRGYMMVLVPEQGLHSSLNNIRQLLKHALQVGRGR